MSIDKPVRRIAIVGTGVIGASWASLYLARGFDVVATDPAPNAEANLRKYIDDEWPLLTRVGVSQGASRDRLSFTTDMARELQRTLVEGVRQEAAGRSVEQLGQEENETLVGLLRLRAQQQPQHA
jgi:predicted dinucleotide-binding enzyme